MIYEDSDLDDEIMPKGSVTARGLVIAALVGISTSILLLILVVSLWH